MKNTSRSVGRMLGAVGALLAVSVLAAEDKDKVTVRATVELTDGSRLIGEPLITALSVKLDYAKLEIPLAKIRQCEIRHQAEQVALTLDNGDRVSGLLETDKLPLQTLVGKLTPGFDLINRLTFAVTRAGGMPAGEGPLNFGGVNWQPWRTQFEVRGEKLMTLPKARPGFNYGHNGNGRSPLLLTNIGSPEWRDYHVEFEFCMSGVDPSFNPHGLPLDFRGGAILFHVADAKESWNECGGSSYSLSLNSDGGWDLSCAYNSYCHTPCGFGDARADSTRKLAEGKGLRIDPKNGNKYRLEIRGTRIQIWVDEEKIVDVKDEQMPDRIGGQTLDHGGVGFLWGYDCMGWIRNFSAQQL